MNRKVLIFSAVFLFAIFSGCSNKDDPEPESLEITPTSLSFGKDAGEGSFSIESNTKWTVSSTVSWLTFTPASGEGNRSVTVSVIANGELNVRTGTVTVKTEGGMEKTVQVTQGGIDPFIILDSDEATVEAAGEEVTVTVNASGAWTVQIPEDAEEWVTLTSQQGVSPAVFTVAANTSTDERSATVTFKLTDDDVQTQFTLTQAEMPPYVSVEEAHKTQNFSSDGDEKTVPVSSNAAFTATVPQADAGWCTVEVTPDGIEIKVDPYYGAADRSTTITLSVTGGSEDVVITVKQNGLGEITYTNVSTITMLNGNLGAEGYWVSRWPMLIACDKDEKLWVNDNSMYILKIDPAAQTYEIVTTNGLAGGSDEISISAGVTSSPDGSRIYVNEDRWWEAGQWWRLHEFNPANNTYLHVNTGIPHDSPYTTDVPYRVWGGVAVDESGVFYIMDSWYRLYRMVAPTRAQIGGEGKDNLDGFEYEILYDLKKDLSSTRDDDLFCIAYCQKMKRLYISSYYMHQIFKWELETGTWSLFAGSEEGYAEGTGAGAKFNTPTQMAVDRNGNLIVVDRTNHCIRRITPDGVTSLVAGTPETAGYADGPPLTAQFNNPYGLCISPSDGKTIYVADLINYKLRKISAE